MEHIQIFSLTSRNLIFEAPKGCKNCFNTEADWSNDSLIEFIESRKIISNIEGSTCIISKLVLIYQIFAFNNDQNGEGKKEIRYLPMI